MRTSKVTIWLLLLAVLSIITVAAKISAKPTTDKPAFAIRKVERQTVLYTIYRGSYDKIGPTIGKLYALAGKKQIQPRASVYYVYLNNPKYVSSEHWLTEIRIPVSKEALKVAGTLGEMTDVKALPAMEVAVAVKPEGQADPGPIYNQLGAWIIKQGYAAIGSPCEMFLTNAMTGSYAQMKSEIMMPIKKLTQHQN